MQSPGAGERAEEPSADDTDVARVRKKDDLRMVDVVKGGKVVKHEIKQGVHVKEA